MYFLIETKEQVKKFFKDEGKSCYMDIIGNNDSKHPILQHPTAIFIYSYTKQQGFIINISHPEAFQLSIPTEYLSKYEVIHVRDKIHCNILIPELNYVDIQLLYWLQHNNTFQEPLNIGAYTFFIRKYPNKDINQFVPIVKHYEYCLEYYNIIQEYTQLDYNIPEYDWYNHNIIPILQKLSTTGIQYQNLTEYFEIDTSLSTANNLIYGWYNILTTTGRPTNSFNKVRFSALNHNNGERECFIPSNDIFIEIDFEGFHPRILAYLTNTDIDKSTSIHQQLAKVYFNTDDITPELYKKSKELTFQQIYGGIKKEYLHSEYFQNIQKLINKLWSDFTNHGCITTFFAKRKITQTNHPNMNPQKLLNYYIQAFETEYNMTLIAKVLKYLENKSTNLVLYVYDSLLLDLAKSDGSSTLVELENIISSDFPAKLKWGPNYNSLGSS